ncbi:MAG: helix-turn-helix domain-containing protein [Pseudomonadales bacterium]
MDSLLRAQFGERLRQVLAARGLKSADLARLTGESATKAAGWLQGKGLMVAGLAQIAVALDVSLDWLVHGVGSEMAPEKMDLSPMEEQLLVALRHYGESTSRHLLGLLQSIEMTGISASLQQLHAKTLLADMALPSVILCHHGNLLVANEAFAHLLGLECDALDALVGQSYKKWLPHRLRSNLLFYWKAR